MAFQRLFGCYNYRGDSTDGRIGGLDQVWPRAALSLSGRSWRMPCQPCQNLGAKYSANKCYCKQWYLGIYLRCKSHQPSDTGTGRQSKTAGDAVANPTACPRAFGSFCLSFWNLAVVKLLGQLFAPSMIRQSSAFEADLNDLGIRPTRNVRSSYGFPVLATSSNKVSASFPRFGPNALISSRRPDCLTFASVNESSP